MFVFVANAELLHALSCLAESLPALRGRALSFELLREDIRVAIERMRASDPLLPVGFVGQSESAVLAALSGGADEAGVLATRRAPELLAFVDRLALRARFRADAELLRSALAQTEKLTALGTLVAGVAHEINNPLSALLLSVSSLRRQAAILARPELSSPLDDLEAAGDAIAAIVRDLRMFTRADDAEQVELVDVPLLIDQIVRLLGHDAAEHGLIERDYSADLPKLVLQRNRLAQVVTNLLSNAVHAIAEIERSEHGIRISVRSDDESLAIAIHDTGPGIAPDALERIFDPFFTTKRQDLGTGLGLAISRSIMRSLGGELSVESVHGDGATFLAFLPLPGERALREARRKAPIGARSPAPGQGSSVLVIARDARMRRAYARLLDAEQRVLLAHTGSEGADLLESGSTPDSVLLDLDLPSHGGQDGLDFLAFLAARRPALCARTLIVTSAETQHRLADRLQGHPGPVLLKPLKGAVLLAALADLGCV